MLLLNNQNPFVADLAFDFVRIISKLRLRSDIDVSTLDSDGGITCIHSRQNSNVIQPYAVESIIRDSLLDLKAEDKVKLAKPQLKLESDLFPQYRQQILNLVNFEDLHDWLAYV